MGTHEMIPVYQCIYTYAQTNNSTSCTSVINPIRPRKLYSTETMMYCSVLSPMWYIVEKEV